MYQRYYQLYLDCGHSSDSRQFTSWIMRQHDEFCKLKGYARSCAKDERYVDEICAWIRQNEA